MQDFLPGDGGWSSYAGHLLGKEKRKTEEYLALVRNTLPL